jgi:hypothetical protein
VAADAADEVVGIIKKTHDEVGFSAPRMEAEGT